MVDIEKPWSRMFQASATFCNGDQPAELQTFGILQTSKNGARTRWADRHGQHFAGCPKREARKIRGT
ncbi:hypothetical protein, partial [Corallococcus praedator]|uniref:hypothetical protein n=1 Tax=Corallococcus praedator TaxID=2316724 RepID=UPI001ABF6007